MKDKNMSNGKDSAVYVCQRNAWRSTYIDTNPHMLACDNLKTEHFKLEQQWTALTVFDALEHGQLGNIRRYEQVIQVTQLERSSLRLSQAET